MRGDLLDIILVIACVAFAISGYRQGFIVGVLSFVGFLGGALLGARFSAPLLSALGWHVNSAVFGLVVVFIGATIGQVLATVIGSAVRRRITWQPARIVDSVGGSAISIISVLLVAWYVGNALVNSTFGGVGRQVRHSLIVTSIDSLMPNSARTLFPAFRRLLDQNGFPQVFGALGPENIVQVPAPNPKVAHSKAVRVAEGDIVKVTGTQLECSKSVEGSGFLYAPQHVLTNAHVVADVRHPVVTLSDGHTTYDARVVLFDPKRDVAVLYVPGFSRTPLSFAGPAKSGASAVVAGYPLNESFTPRAARIREQESAPGYDIYQRSTVTRQIYSLRAVVQPGNSGGPLLAPDGRVYGVVFATSTDRPDTGYALTAAYVEADAAAGASRTGSVSTDGCTEE